MSAPGQGGVDVFVLQQEVHADAGSLRRYAELLAEHVLAHLTHKGGVLTQLLQHGQHIAGCAAGVGLQKGVALTADAVFRKVHQKLAQGDHIITLFHGNHSISSSYFSTSTRTLPSEEKLTAAASRGV